MRPATLDLGDLGQAQARLVQTLLSGELDLDALGLWFQGPGPADRDLQAGLTAYRRNLLAHARAALTADHPALAAAWIEEIGEAGWRQAVGAYLDERPPAEADWAGWSRGWSDWLAARPRPAGDFPSWACDLARLEALCAQLESAADPVAEPGGLALPSGSQPEDLKPRWAAGTCRLSLGAQAWRRARREGDMHGTDSPPPPPDEAEAVELLVWRQRWRARTRHLADPPLRRWVDALRAGATLSGAALEAGPELDLEAAYVEAISQGWWVGWAAEAECESEPIAAMSAPPPRARPPLDASQRRPTGTP